MGTHTVYASDSCGDSRLATLLHNTESGNMKRDWVGGTGDTSGETFTILQWNILAQSLGEYGDFSLCPVEALQWDHRKDLLLKVQKFM